MKNILFSIQGRILPFVYQLMMISLVFVFSLNTLFGQEPNYIHYTVEDGLPSNSLYGAMQDKDGYIWLYSEKGISKFDGYTFKNYTVADGLPTNDIWKMTETSDGRLWLHSFHNQLCYLKNDSVHFIKSKPISRMDLTVIHEDEEGVWASCDNRCYRIVDNRAVEINKTISDSLLKDPLLILWHELNLGTTFNYKKYNCIESRTGFQIKKNGEFIPIYREMNKPGNSYLGSTILPRSTSEVVIDYSEKGLLAWTKEDGIKRRFSYKSIFPDRNFKVSVVKVVDDKIVINSGFSYFELDEDLNILDVFEPKSIKAKASLILKDKSANIWIPTRDKGLYFLPANNRHTITFTSGNIFNGKVTRIYGDNSKIYWGTSAGGVYQLDENEIKEIFPEVEGFGNEVRVLICDDNGSLLTERGGDLIFLEKKINRKENLGRSNFKDAAWDATTQSYILTTPYSRYQIKNSDYLELIDNDPYLKAGAVAVEKSGKIWIGHLNGLRVLLRDSSVVTIDTFPELNHVHDLKIDNKNRLWIANDKIGLAVLENGILNPINGFEGILVADIFIENDSVIWVATNNGLKKLEIGTDVSQSKIIKNYSHLTGLPSEELTSVWVNEKYIFVGSGLGLSRIEKEERENQKEETPLYLTKLSINGEQFDISKKLELEHFENELEAEFVALDYGSVGEINYEYFLEGADIDWQSTSTPRVRYAGLPPGNYRFLLKVADSDGNLSAAKEFFNLKISPPWWQTWWFRLLLSIAIVSLVYAIYRYRIRQIKAQEAEQTAIQKKFSELELQALRSQMNPHFVFNALGAIQYYIRKNNRKLANEYLSKFAGLMRLFLDSSREKYITIADELKLIKLYLELEQMRFENRFEVAFEIDKKLETDSIYLPSMLLQPFVENAVNHGLFNKIEKGYLYIKISEKEDEEKIEIIIEDDGIGMKRAKEIRKNSIKNYKSRSTQIVDERLDILEKVENLGIDIVYEIPFPEREDPGTRIIIDLPIID